VARVAIIDSGGANLASLVFALQRLGAESVVTTSADAISRAERVLLPGVGSAGNAMARLRAAGLDSVIPTLKQPLLGICLGMQLLYEWSEESDDGQDTRCLGVIPGRVARIPASPDLPVPHMGWNRTEPVADPLFAGLGRDDYFYFVHSFAAPVSAATLAVTGYGAEFSAACRHANFRGVQFHPERSAAPGARLIDNFLKLPA
jgi:glutamine amidotransferase